MAVLQNSPAQYSLVAKLFHWVSALAVVFLFVLGLWMIDLDYYHEWYQQAPNLHIGVGVCLTVATLLRLFYRAVYHYPEPVAGTSRSVGFIAKGAHWAMYLLLLVIFVSGYLIVTAEGEVLSVFGAVEVPALMSSSDNLQDQAGVVHLWLAYGLMGLAVVHAVAALHHHFIVRDNTLLRMLTRAKVDRDPTRQQ